MTGRRLATRVLSAGRHKAAFPGYPQPQGVVLPLASVHMWAGTSGLTEESYSAKITFPRGQGTAPAVAARPATGGLGFVAIVTGAILIALLAALAALIITYRRRHDKNQPRAHQGL